jgi:hypothetical protein
MATKMGSQSSDLKFGILILPCWWHFIGYWYFLLTSFHLKLSIQNSLIWIHDCLVFLIHLEWLRLVDIQCRNIISLTWKWLIRLESYKTESGRWSLFLEMKYIPDIKIHWFCIIWQWDILSRSQVHWSLPVFKINVSDILFVLLFPVADRLFFINLLTLV